MLCSFPLVFWCFCAYFRVLLFPRQEGIGDRYGTDFTLLLTIVAFKLVLASYLPPVSYLTYLDK